MEIQADSLMTNNQKEWKSIEILGAQYIISTTAMKNSWKISVSNLIEIWTEIITKETALKRCQSLNLLLDLDSFDIRGTLDGIFDDIPSHATEKSLHQIKLETCIDGVGFKFTINLKKGTPHEFWNEITEPLCNSSMELQRRHKIILDLMKQKEEELSEYRLSGAQLTRKNIGTTPYNKQIFENKISIHDGESKDYVTAFQSMMNVYNEMKKYESLLTSNSAKHLPQRSSNANPTQPDRKPKRENTKASEMTLANYVINDNALESRVKVETLADHPSISENKSITSETEISKLRKEVGASEPRASESKISLQSKKKLKTQLTVNNVAILPETSIEHRSKKPKMTPNIYDLIA